MLGFLTWACVLACFLVRRLNDRYNAYGGMHCLYGLMGLISSTYSLSPMHACIVCIIVWYYKSKSYIWKNVQTKCNLLLESSGQDVMQFWAFLTTYLPIPNK